MTFHWEYVVMILLAAVGLGFAVATVRTVLELRRRDMARKLRREKTLPTFEAEFGCRPNSKDEHLCLVGGYTDKVRTHMADLSRLVGEAAISQEVGRITSGTTRQHQDMLDRRMVAAKAKWGQATNLIKEVDPHLYNRLYHWSEEEPYASHREKFHADLT